MARRNDIVREAQALFAEQGYRSTTVADIAKAAGLSPSAGGLYRHFRSKADVLTAVVDDALAQVAKAEELRLQAESADFPVPDEIRITCAYLIRRLRESVDILRILERDLADHPEQAARVETHVVTPVLDGFEAWLRHLGSRSPKEPEAPRQWAAVLWGAAYHHAVTPSAATRSDRRGALATTDEEFIEGWTSLLLAGLGHQTGNGSR